MKIKLIHSIFILGVCGSFLSCKDAQLQEFSGVASVNFWLHEDSRSFYGKSPAEKNLDTIKINLAAVGYTTPYDREVTIEAYVPEDQKDEEGQFRATPDMYRMLGGVIPAGKTYGEFKLEIINKERLMTDEMKLSLRILPNKHFAHSLKENETIQLKWSAKLMQPKTWDAMQYYFCSTYSTRVYKLIIQAMDGKTEFYYFEPDENGVTLSPNDATLLGMKFTNIVNAYNEEHKNDEDEYTRVLRHDDGPSKDQPIIPKK